MRRFWKFIAAVALLLLLTGLALFSAQVPEKRSAMPQLIYRNFATEPSPFYPDVPNAWWTPTWPLFAANDPDDDTQLLLAENVDIVSNRLSFLASDPVISGAAWGNASGVNYGTTSMHDAYNNNSPHTLYWEADVLLTTAIYTANDVPWAPLFSLYSRSSIFSNTMELAVAYNAPAFEIYIGYLDGNGGWEDNGGIPIYADVGGLIGTTVNFRLEMTPASLVVPTDPQDYLVNLDGIIRLYINDVLEYESTVSPFVPSYPNVNAYQQYEVGSVAIGFSGFAGEYEYLDFGYELPVGLPEVGLNIDPGATIGLTWVEFTDALGAVHVWSQHALPDPASYYEGWKEPRVLEWNEITRSLSDHQGQYVGSQAGWLNDDTDLAIRQLLNSTRYFYNRVVVIRTISDPDRRALLTPRTIFRGRVRGYEAK